MRDSKVLAHVFSVPYIRDLTLWLHLLGAHEIQPVTIDILPFSLFSQMKFKVDENAPTGGRVASDLKWSIDGGITPWRPTQFIDIEKPVLVLHKTVEVGSG